MIGEVIAGRYELEALVGSGGMSSVYRAHDRLLDRRVALKILHEHYSNDEEYVERFRREARAVAQLSHPHIVTVIDRGADDGRQFIVFEYVEGENLKQLVERHGQLPVRRALELAIAVADALAFAHAHGLVHRDVKPQNVLLDVEGEVKVTDFGIARSLGVDRGVTQTGTVLGTSTYISPEQAGGKPVTPATDVYALGVVLWELVTGEVPFPGDNFVAVALRHINEPPPSLLAARPDAPPRLAAAIERALAKDPARRFRSMKDFAAELRACLAELGGGDPEQTLVSMPAAAPKAPARTMRRRARRSRGRLLAAAVVAVAAVAAVVAGVLALGGSGTSPGHGTSGGGTGTPVALRGVGDYDPQGSGGEHGETAPAATDGDPATSWYTETYAS
ncbi:MAG: serine/threonine protein kinase, partial [Thermoleophilia bacterium]|nr:serine/threonine protein kinase [Thermoleophilia bacterium]